jgi:hypothetical protein
MFSTGNILTMTNLIFFCITDDYLWEYKKVYSEIILHASRVLSSSTIPNPIYNIKHGGLIIIIITGKTVIFVTNLY